MLICVGCTASHVAAWFGTACCKHTAKVGLYCHEPCRSIIACVLLRCACREQDPKRVYYMSMEFLMGRSLLNTLYNLGIKDQYAGQQQQLCACSHSRTCTCGQSDSNCSSGGGGTPTRSRPSLKVTESATGIALTGSSGI